MAGAQYALIRSTLVRVVNGAVHSVAGGWLSWDRLRRLLRLFPLPPAQIVHSIYRPAAIG
jgi:hypothetical protein